MYLIDTDILVYSLKGQPQVLGHLQRTASDPKAISVISYGELLYGAQKSARVDENLARVRRLGEVLPIIEVSPAIMEAFGSLKARLELDGRRLDGHHHRLSPGDEQRTTLRAYRRPLSRKLGDGSALKAFRAPLFASLHCLGR